MINRIESIKSIDRSIEWSINLQLKSKTTKREKQKKNKHKNQNTKLTNWTKKEEKKFVKILFDFNGKKSSKSKIIVLFWWLFAERFTCNSK